MPAQEKPWTKEEVEILKEGYSKPNYNINSIAIQLNRSIASVYMKAYFLGITKKWPRKNSFSYNAWVPNNRELNYLKENVENKSFNKISEDLGKSAHTISRACKRLGLVPDVEKVKKESLDGPTVPRTKERKSKSFELSPTVKRDIESRISGESRIREAMERLRI